MDLRVTRDGDYLWCDGQPFADVVPTEVLWADARRINAILNHRTAEALIATGALTEGLFKEPEPWMD